LTHSVLLLSAYDAVSHQLWRQRLCGALDDYHWASLSLPARHFAWRIRSNGLHWAYQQKQILEQPFDLIIATSMVDLATLRGLRPSLAQLPTILYFHENQFAYPAGRQRNDNIEPMLVPVYSALCADRIVFNTEYNRHTFLRGVAALSTALPEPFPQQALQQLEQARVIPVPLPDPVASKPAKTDTQCLNVIWNHRWEYDKGPELLLQIVRHCCDRGLPIRFHIVGQQFREHPAQFAEIDRLLGEFSETAGMTRGAFGFLPENEYRQLLAQGDVVLSTALHDFQGLAVQEACLSGCSALVPNDLAYPEYLPKACLYDHAASDADTGRLVAARLKQLVALKKSGSTLPAAELDSFALASVAQQYRSLIEELLAGN
jgi:glycosyltransferase involved in cell wall biosynthesis